MASFPFARRYLGNRCFFLLLGLLRCFSSPRFLILRYFIHTAVPAHYYRWVPPFGNLRFITDICSLPQLIAACHVLRRLLVPRHPPYALFNLTSCLSFSPSASLPSLASVLTYLCTLRSSLLQRLVLSKKSCASCLSFARFTVLLLARLSVTYLCMRPPHFLARLANQAKSCAIFIVAFFSRQTLFKYPH